MSTRRERLVIDPGDASGPRPLSIPEVRKLIGRHIELADYGAAAAICMQAAARLPDTFWPHHVAAEMLFLCEDYDGAFQHIDRALEIEPDNTGGYVVKARLCMQAGDSIQALRLIDAALDLQPRDSKLHTVRAELLADSGDIKAARDSYLESVELDVRNAGGLLGLSRLPGDHFGEKLIKMVEFLLHSGQLAGEDEIKADFALANVYDKRGDIERHMAHLRAGNDKHRRFADFDPAASDREAQRIIEVFSKDFIARHAGIGGNPARIIFIVGFPRCGSTLVDQILCCHPQVAGAGETHALPRAIAQFERANALPGKFPDWLRSHAARALTHIAADYLRRVEKIANRTWLTDKLLANYESVGLIHLAFPNAHIVNVQRNPIDVCYSCYKNLFFSGTVPYAYDLGHLAAKYREYRRIIDHWHTVLPGKIHTVRYEALIERQRATTRELLDRCGLPWDDACLDFRKSRQAVRTSSNIQVRQELYRDSVERWRKYRDYLGPLLDLAES